MRDIVEIFIESIKVKQKVVDSDAAQKISIMAELIARSIEKGGKLLLCGNGGSAADAQHLAAELVVRFRPNVNRRAICAISLALDTSTLTACGNDFSFSEIFSRSLEALANPGDILIAISTSGNSENIELAIKKAKEMGVKSCALLGCNGGRIKSLADIEYIVPSNETARVQEVHAMLGHALIENIEDRLIKLNYISL